jgi:hypothetical protein
MYVAASSTHSCIPVYSVLNTICKVMAFQLLLSQLFHVPEVHDKNLIEDFSPFDIPWGFTVYRTCYTADSDKQWQILTEHIKTTLPEYMLRARNDKTDSTPEEMLSRLRLDFRSDADVLKNLDMDQVRQVFLNHVGGKPVNTELSWCRLFLLADEEVLADVPGAPEEKRWIKCVQADYIPADYVPKIARMLLQRYFGWTKMTTRSFVDLWEELATKELSEIAQGAMDGAHSVTCK